MKQKCLLFLCLFFAVTPCVFSQTASAVTQTLSSDSATYGDACYYMASYLGIVPDTADAEEAYSALCAEGICREGMECGGALTYGALAGLCMNTFDMHGGIMYSLTKSDHYAFRELQSRKFIDERRDPQEKVPGAVMLNIINRCTESAGGEEDDL